MSVETGQVQAMKLLTTNAQWKKWLKDEIGVFADQVCPAPLRFPCYAYTELESWGQETLRPLYLYQKDIEGMAIELVVASQKQ